MKVYRYESKDGSGPYYNLDGTSKLLVGDKILNINSSKDNWRYGCDSIKNLKKYFKNSKQLSNGYSIYLYDVDVPEYRYIKENGHILFNLNEVKIKKLIK